MAFEFLNSDEIDAAMNFPYENLRLAAATTKIDDIKFSVLNRIVRATFGGHATAPAYKYLKRFNTSNCASFDDIQREIRKLSDEAQSSPNGDKLKTDRLRWACAFVNTTLSETKYRDPLFKELGINQHDYPASASEKFANAIVRISRSVASVEKRIPREPRARRVLKKQEIRELEAMRALKEQTTKRTPMRLEAMQALEEPEVKQEKSYYDPTQKFIAKINEFESANSFVDGLNKTFEYQNWRDNITHFTSLTHLILRIMGREEEGRYLAPSRILGALNYLGALHSLVAKRVRSEHTYKIDLVLAALDRLVNITNTKSSGFRVRVKNSEYAIYKNPVYAEKKKADDNKSDRLLDMAAMANRIGKIEEDKEREIPEKAAKQTKQAEKKNAQNIHVDFDTNVFEKIKNHTPEDLSENEMNGVMEFYQYFLDFVKQNPDMSKDEFIDEVGGEMPDVLRDHDALLESLFDELRNIGTNAKAQLRQYEKFGFGSDFDPDVELNEKEIMKALGPHYAENRLLHKMLDHNILSREEMNALRRQAGPTGENINDKDITDWTAIDKMICSNLRLVFNLACKYARKYPQKHLSAFDLFQEGSVGLRTAAVKYDPDRGYKFATMAWWWVSQAITRAIADQGRTVRVPVHRHEEFSKISRTIKSFANEHGRKPTDEELAEMLEWPAKKLQKVLGYMRRQEISFETSGRKDDDTGEIWSSEDEIGCEDPGYKSYETNDFFQKFFEIVNEMVLSKAEWGKYTRLADLNKLRNLYIFYRYYKTELELVDSYKKMATLQSIGDEMGVSRELVRQIFEKILERLRRSPELRACFGNRLTKQKESNRMAS